MSRAKQLGEQLALELLDAGGRDILDELERKRGQGDVNA